MNISKKKTFLSFVKEVKKNGLETDTYFQPTDKNVPVWAVVDGCMLYKSGCGAVIWSVYNPTYPNRKPLVIGKDCFFALNWESYDYVTKEAVKVMASMCDYTFPYISIEKASRTPQSFFDILTRDFERMEKAKPILKALHELFK